MLRSLPARLGRVPCPPPPAFDKAPVTESPDFESPTTFVGDSSLTAQSTFAGEFVEIAIRAGPQAQADSRIRDALESLRQIVAMQKEQSNTAELGSSGQYAPFTGRVHDDLQMPPLDVVLGLMRQIKGLSNIRFSPVLSAQST